MSRLNQDFTDVAWESEFFLKSPRSHPLVPVECCADYSLRSSPLEAGQTIEAGSSLEPCPPRASGQPPLLHWSDSPSDQKDTFPPVYPASQNPPGALEEVLRFHHRSRQVGSANLDWRCRRGEGCTQQGRESCSQASACSPRRMQRKHLIWDDECILVGRVNLSPKHIPSAVASTLKFQPEIHAFDDVFSSVLGRKALQRNKTTIFIVVVFFF